MSDAMRELNEGTLDYDSVPGIDEAEQAEGQQPEVQEPESYEPEAAPEGHEPEPDQEPPPQQQDRKPKPKGSARDWAEREKKRADRAVNDLKTRDQQLAQQQQQLAQMRTEVESLQRQAKINANPTLRRAHELMQEGYKPENVEADAQLLEAEGDKKGADIARQIAMHMRNLGAEEAQAQEVQAAQQAETAWRQIPYGTPEYDQALWNLKPGSPEFNNAWGWTEKNFIKGMSQSQDPWDQECARQFSDPKSEFGQMLIHFFQSDLGREIGKHAEGIIPAFGLCKGYLIMNHQAAEIARLREENEALRGATSPSSGMPVNGNSYQPSLPNPQTDRNAFLTAFEKQGVDEMRRWIRSRESA